jgi:hypothetical protein
VPLNTGPHIFVSHAAVYWARRAASQCHSHWMIWLWRAYELDLPSPFINLITIFVMASTISSSDTVHLSSFISCCTAVNTLNALSWGSVLKMGAGTERRVSLRLSFWGSGPLATSFYCLCCSFWSRRAAANNTAVQRVSNLNFSSKTKWRLRCVLKWSCVGDIHVHAWIFSGPQKASVGDSRPMSEEV